MPRWPTKPNESLLPIEEPLSERLPSLHEVAALIYAARVGKSAVVTPKQAVVEAYELAGIFVAERSSKAG